MSTMITEIYTAFIEAGASEEKATAAAEAIESVKESERLSKIEKDITELDKKIVQLDGKVTGKFALLQWMVSFNLAVSGTLLFLIIRYLVK